MRILTCVAAAALSVPAFTTFVSSRSIESASDAVEASTCIQMRVEDLAARCDLALEARVTSKSTTVDALGRIATDYSLAVDRTYFGVAQTSRTVRVPGGVLPDGRGLVLPGMPKLNVGENAILFLSRENQHAERLPIGLAQGRMRVLRDADGVRTLESDVRDLELVDAKGQPVVVPRAVTTLPYADTVSRIETVCAQRVRDAAKGARK